MVNTFDNERNSERNCWTFEHYATSSRSQIDSVVVSWANAWRRSRFRGRGRRNGGRTIGQCACVFRFGGSAIAADGRRRPFALGSPMRRPTCPGGTTLAHATPHTSCACSLCLTTTARLHDTRTARPHVHVHVLLSQGPDVRRHRVPRLPRGVAAAREPTVLLASKYDRHAHPLPSRRLALLRPAIPRLRAAILVRCQPSTGPIHGLCG